MEKFSPILFALFITGKIMIYIRKLRFVKMYLLKQKYI